MSMVFDLLGGLLGGPQMMMALLVFLAAATLAFLAMAGARVRGEVKRRAKGIRSHGEEQQGSGARGLRQSSLNAAKQLLDYTTKHYSTGDNNEMKVLRRRLMQAGIYNPHGVGFFFLMRTGLAIGLAVTVFFLAPALISAEGSKFWMMVG